MKNPFGKSTKNPEVFVVEQLQESACRLSFSRLYPNCPLVSTLTIPSTVKSHQFIPARLKIQNAVERRADTTRYFRLDKLRWKIKHHEGLESNSQRSRHRRKPTNEVILAEGKVKAKREETALKLIEETHTTNILFQIASPGAIKKMSIMQRNLIAGGWNMHGRTINITADNVSLLCLVLELEIVEELYDNKDLAVIDTGKRRLYGATYVMAMGIEDGVGKTTEIVAVEEEALPRYAPALVGGLPTYEESQAAIEGGVCG